MDAPLSTVPTHVAQETGFALSLGHLCPSFRPGGGDDDDGGSDDNGDDDDDDDDENGNDDNDDIIQQGLDNKDIPPKCLPTSDGERTVQKDNAELLL